uniref:Transmembrane protein 14C n=1 Tax=Aplanochytrium stocchinoi TaxID=215587 RepID=A0A6S8AEH9_9STRA|mmetsp:Transcript_14314/g.17683  ORF Transcript_14314/g.17683 Transcript_14314/m.17683 type:complete len:111 (+) Transcript_14314:353-685(+)|eukprot:CAMPEP_0204822068 /NCGR_PEP_ID=MMETSP1346-20131115/251_1 /ASSEMBLY_ACC=CAM_ASM_000771 /TAXON_ID=215587 /ORGANISM="Aplanochytrium stocchinoi, Strain GSBS06" /LENGTH=110 /DNA_ID=CAMNT_0051948085 /DNA_START=341 /DNA_END=673 /DNA_ORIENTATION=+
MRKVSGEAHASLGMSALLFSGGALGYARGKSIPSLVAGSVFGTGYAISGWLLSRGDGKEGHTLSLALSSTLFAVMGIRFAKSRKMMPAGALTGVSGLSATYHGVKAVEWW